MALLDALGMHQVIEAMCPGKVLRLMAADVVWWHQTTGGEPAPDTFVWNDLPFPWDVVSGRADCPQEFVEEACRKHGVDPVKSGWTAPRSQRRIVQFRPTPELVHGVTVQHPALALHLRKIGVFSGKKLKLPSIDPLHNPSSQ